MPKEYNCNCLRNRRSCFPIQNISSHIIIPINLMTLCGCLTKSCPVASCYVHLHWISLGVLLPFHSHSKSSAVCDKWPSSLLPKHFAVEANFLVHMWDFNSYTSVAQFCSMILWPISLKLFKKINLTESFDLCLLKITNFLWSFKKKSWFYMSKSHLTECH